MIKKCSFHNRRIDEYLFKQIYLSIINRFIMLSIHEQQLQRIVWSMIQPIHEKLDTITRRLNQMESDIQRVTTSVSTPPPLLLSLPDPVPVAMATRPISHHVPGSAQHDSDHDGTSAAAPAPAPLAMPSFRDSRGYPRIIIVNYIEENAVTQEFAARCMKKQSLSGEFELFNEVYLKGRSEQEVFEIIRYENGHYYYNSRDKMIRSSNADEMIYRLMSSIQETYRHCLNTFIRVNEPDYYMSTYTTINQYIDSILERTHMERFLGQMRSFITIEPEVTPARRDKPLRPRHK